MGVLEAKRLVAREIESMSQINIPIKIIIISSSSIVLIIIVVVIYLYTSMDSPKKSINSLSSY